MQGALYLPYTYVTIALKNVVWPMILVCISLIRGWSFLSIVRERTSYGFYGRQLNQRHAARAVGGPTGVCF